MPPPAPPALPLRSQPPAVLVADDVDEIRRLIAIWLKAAGYRVVLVSSGNDGIRQANSTPLALVITDVLMPDGDGLDLIRAVRQAQPRAGIVAISGGGRERRAVDCINEAMALGAKAALLKPFTAVQFRAAVAAALA